MDFDDIAHQYDTWFTTPLGVAVDAWEKELTWRLARPEPGQKVLDIGTGTANYLLELARMGLDCTGLDVVHRMLLRARRKSLEWGVDLKLVTATGGCLPFPDRSFDLVLSVTAFEFFPDPAQSVREMIRVCRPGGRIVVGVLNQWSVWAARRRILSWFRESIFSGCRFYSYPEMLRLFGPVEWGTAAFAPPGLPPALIPLFRRLEPHLQRWAKPFGAYLALCKHRPMKTEYEEMQPYTTKDGSLIRELMHPDVHGNERQSLAEALLPPGRETLLHRHRTTEEIYHVTEGSGSMTLGYQELEIKTGDTICIPPGTAHRVRNSGAGPLRILCSCSPPYSHEDTVLIA